MQADAPATRRLDHLAAERFRHQLMTETDADHRALSARFAHEILRVMCSSCRRVYARSGSCDDIGIAGVDAARQLADARVERGELVLRAEQFPDHRAAGAELFIAAAAADSGLKNANLDRHGEVSLLRRHDSPVPVRSARHVLRRGGD